VTSVPQAVGSADRADARPAGPRPVRVTKAARQRRKWFEIIGLTTPAFLVFSAFVLLPIGFAAYYSLFRWNGVGWPHEFRGLYYYFGQYGALRDPVFQDSLRNTGVLLVGSLLIQGPLALTMALLLNRKFRGRAVFRLLVFVPYVLAEVTVGVIFLQMLQFGGPVNSLLNSLGFGPIDWLGDTHVVLWTLLIVLTWKYTGFALILFLAGLSNVPDELSEAAAIDGASWWQIQRHITIPLLGPTIRIWAFLSMIGCLQVFDVVWVVASRAVRGLGSGSVIATYMVDNGYTSHLWGLGNAVAVILFIVSFVTALLCQRFLLRRDIDGALSGRVN
jgi:raffinose/stachyose/melibiose transport system permease protein